MTIVDPSDLEDYDEVVGDVVSIYTCPECGEELRVEWRGQLPEHMFGLACPHGHIGLPVRIRDPARLDEAFESRQPRNCWNCQEEIHAENPPETDDGYPLHPGECADEYRELQRRVQRHGGDA